MGHGLGPHSFFVIRLVLFVIFRVLCPADDSDRSLCGLCIGPAAIRCFWAYAISPI
jgi:hypothetical protein